MKESLTKSDLAYRKYLWRKNVSYIIITVCVLLCSATLFVLEKQAILKMEEHTKDFLMGMFGAMVGILLVFIVYNHRIIHHPDRLRKQRIIAKDERNLLILQKSHTVTMYTMLFSLVAVSVYGAFFDELLTKVASALIYLFAASYFIGYLYYKRKN